MGGHGDEIEADELVRRLAAHDDLLLLDVRQPAEFAQGHLPGAILVPVPELPRRYAGIDPEREIVAYCAVGERSLWAVAFLRQRGYPRVLNLRGGIHAWAHAAGATIVT